jgi:hypothetical protein
MTPKPRPDDKEQAAAFRKAARELGADASDAQFQATLRKVAKAKPASEKRKERRD